MVFSRALRRFPRLWMKGVDSFSTPELLISLLYMHRRALGRDWAKTLKNDFEWRQLFNYFIKMKDYFVKTTRSLRAEWNSRNTLYSLRKGFQVVLIFIWFYGNTGAVDDLPRSRNSKKRKTSHRQGKKVSSEWRLFSEMNFYSFSCYRIESKYQELRGRRHFPPSARETGIESSLGLSVKTMVTVDWRPPNCRFESLNFWVK